MTTTFPANKIQRLRRKAAKASEPSDETNSGWSISTNDPNEIVKVFKPLQIRDQFELKSYQFRSGGNGNGIVWAMPVDAEFPEPEDCPRQEGVFLEPPKPLAALDDVMEAIEGDGTPWSYMCASMLARELAEFGAMWHGCSWGTHTVLGANPWNPTKDKKRSDVAQWMTPVSEWAWSQRPPKAWSPSVTEADDGVVVRFYTFSQLGQEGIYGHTDKYKAGSYRFESDRQEIATGPGGVVF